MAGLAIPQTRKPRSINQIKVAAGRFPAAGIFLVETT
ncbi:MAG: hypothetical protein ACI8X5_000314 [Planctomycetota bacterium]|jgi:hypothetical protein